MATLDPTIASIAEFRRAVPLDMKCVIDNWLKSYKTSPWAGVVTNDQYYDVHHETIRQLLARGAKLLVACNRTDPNQILGWICYEAVDGGDCVHFVYVKETAGLRRRGIAAELVRQACSGSGRRFYTFRTRAAGYLFADWQFAPEICRRKKR